MTAIVTRVARAGDAGSRPSPQRPPGAERRSGERRQGVDRRWLYTRVPDAEERREGSVERRRYERRIPPLGAPGAAANRLARFPIEQFLVRAAPARRVGTLVDIVV